MWELSILVNKNIFLSFCIFMWIEKNMQIMILFQTKILSINNCVNFLL